MLCGGCFAIVLSRVSTANLSLQYVNSMNCMAVSSVGFWLGAVVWMAYDAHYVGFEPGIAVAPLGIACAWE